VPRAWWNTCDVNPATGSDAPADQGDSGRSRVLALKDVLAVLAHGEIEVQGRLPYSSNGTYLVQVHSGPLSTGAVYKPLAGERPLWDFPPGLHRREVAAFELAVALGMPIIPPTVLRDGPLGEGSVQLFIDADFEQHYFTLVEDEQHHDQLRQICVFDLVANSTDRKSGHCLLARDGRIWGIDNGLCFAREFKLRTVIWDFAGEPIPAAWDDRLCQVAAGSAGGRLRGLLAPAEIDAVARRAGWLAEQPEFPHDDTGHRWPWPLV
jgi:uncharacterized repeat protein (TIGR03843 family)